MKKTIKISIIVPAYNVQRYVEKCIKSITSQDTGGLELEIIIVDDASTDDTLKICMNMARNDKRIRVLKSSAPKNKGLSATRNRGLEVISGDYVMFVDSDDWVNGNLFCEIAKRLREKRYDLIMFPYIREYSNKSIKCQEYNQDQIFENGEYKRKIYMRFFGLYGDMVKRADSIDNISAVWGKLYSVKLVKGMKFRNTQEIGAEDILFNAQVLYRAKNALYVVDTWYHYNKENVNSLTKNYDSSLIEKWNKLYTRLYETISDYGLDDSYKQALNNRIIVNTFFINRSVLNTKNTYLEKRTIIINNLKNNEYLQKVNYDDYSCFDYKWKTYIFFLRHNLYIGIFAMNRIAEKMKKVIK